MPSDWQGTPCDLWVGFTDPNGYGKRSYRGRPTLVHRAAWLESGRAIPRGWHIHHVCGERLCVNLDHLTCLSPTEHRWAHVLIEMEAKGLDPEVHCINGHRWEDDNLYVYKGRRRCQECRRVSSREGRARARARRALDGKEADGE